MNRTRILLNNNVILPLRMGNQNSAKPRKYPRFGHKQDAGHGWYQLYKEEGPEGFRKYQPPTPYDWENAIGKEVRKRVFLNITLDKDNLGDIVIETADEILPITSKNFQNLCSIGNHSSLGSVEEKEKDLVVDNDYKENNCNQGYKGTKLIKIVKGSSLIWGDVEKNDGTGGFSSMGKRFFEDEGYYIPHSHEGIVSMVSHGVDYNASQFYITSASSPHLDGRCVAFGRVIKGMDIIKNLMGVFSMRGVPVETVTISNCGVVVEDELKK